MTVDVWEVMGTVVSLRIPDRFERVHDIAVHGVREVLAMYDVTYSLYRDDSPLSQLARGEVALAELDENIRDTYARAIEWRNRTGGAFTPHRADDVIDLSGIVKADAIAAGAEVIRAHGVDEFSLNVGGDLVVAGDTTWPTAIGHPTDPSAMIAGVTLDSTWCAIATSGTFDRGEHIWRSVSDGPTIISATVISHDIVTSDVWATAIISGGPAMAEAATQDGCAVLYFDSELNSFGNGAMDGLYIRANEPQPTS
ncbi:MAG: Thiamine biosynthesis lipoprotein ApbE precursor [Actinomycetota bacterium]